MSDHYRITVKISFGIMANSIIEAENIAKEYCQIDKVPRMANVTYDADMTLNQAEYLKREAANYYD